MNRRFVLPGRVWLAPMAGVTDVPFRALCFESGCDFAVTEMVSARASLCAPDSRRSARQLLETRPGERVALQLFGSEPEVVAEAVRRFSGARNNPFAFIDINMGCPAPKITGNGEGSALMRDLPLAYRVLKAAVDASRLPVTVKHRAGWDASLVNAADFAKMAQDAGVAAITVHGRTRAQQYAGKADLHVIAAVKAAVSVPVIGNGDVSGGPSALAMMDATGCDAVMIGRGALGNPFVFEEVQRALRGLPPRAVTAGDRLSLAARHARMMAAYKGERVAAREMRKHVAWAIRGMRGAGALRARVNEAASLQDTLDLLTDFMRKTDDA